MASRRTPLMTLATASALVALTGCAPGQTFGPPCPLADFDVVIEVKVITDEEVEEVGICDEVACTTDDEIPAESEVGDLYMFNDGEEGTWSFSVIRWMPEQFGLVATVDDEEVDLGTHQADITYHEIDGPHCGSIPEYAPITVDL